MSGFFERILAWLIVRVPIFFAQSLTLDSDSSLGRWYLNNGLYKFKIGRKIKPKGFKPFGYGIRPEGVIIAHLNEENILGEREDLYLIEMEMDRTGNYFDWVYGKTTYAERVKEIQKHSKWNIEHHFVSA